MNYPLLKEYKQAIIFAEDNFEELKHLRPVLDDAGKPVFSSGNFAVVFKMKDEQTGKLHAVKLNVLSLQKKSIRQNEKGYILRYRWCA